MSNQRYRDSINVSNDFSSKVLVVSRDLKKKLLIPSIVNNHLVMYPTPTSLTYFWNFGSLAGFFLVIQIVSGLFLAMHYSSDIKLAFDSVEHIMRDVNYGWQIRYAHANGASMFLFIVYIHMARGLFYKSYISPRETLWYTGVTLFLLLMATAFLGYVLPWGQMSFWGATVITNLASAIPIVGPKIALWLWGGFSVANATLTRFFALHFLLPLVMVGLTLVHLAELHQSGSSAPAGTEDSGDFMPFYPYFLIKDFFGFTCFLFFYFALIYYEPNMLGHPDNYIRANPLVTPAHIVPEWYFLPFYAILRSVPSKLGGVVLMGGAIVILYFLPTINSFKVRWFSKFKLPSIDFFIKPFTLRLVFKKAKFFKVPRMYWQFSIFFSFWVVSFLLLGILGGKPVEFPYSELSVVSAVYYFFFFNILRLIF